MGLFESYKKISKTVYNVNSILFIFFMIFVMYLTIKAYNKPNTRKQEVKSLSVELIIITFVIVMMFLLPDDIKSLLETFSFF